MPRSDGTLSEAERIARGLGGVRSRDEEHQEQSLLFQWAEEAAKRQHPELDAMFAVPNFAGFHGSRAARLRSGARAKREGRRKGMLDVCLPVARGGWHALYVEMKTEEGSLSPEQKQWVTRLTLHGNRVEVCRRWGQARDVILAYLALPKTQARAA